MTETATAPSTPKKTTKSAKAPKAFKPKVAPNHPPVATLVKTAIGALNEKGGSSLIAIKKHIAANNKVEIDRLNPFIRRFLKSAVAKGALVQVKGKGATGSFKLNNAVKEAKPKVAKPKTVKPKEASAKATTPKKAKASPKKAAAAKLKAAKPAKAPAAAKKPKAAAKPKPEKSPKKAAPKKAAPKKVPPKSERAHLTRLQSSASILFPKRLFSEPLI